MIDRELQLRELMLRSLRGDVLSARALLTELREHLLAYYRRRLPPQDCSAEDLVQECLLAIHAKRATYDPSLPFSAWVHAIARYKLIDYLRRSGRSRTIPIDSVPEAVFERSEGVAAYRDITRILSMLPDRQRALVEDVRIAGYSFAEAAVRHGLSEGAAKVRVHRSLKALSKWVSANER